MKFSAAGRAGPGGAAGPGVVSRVSAVLPQTPDLPAIEIALLEHWRIERAGRRPAGQADGLAPCRDDGLAAEGADAEPPACFCDPLPASELPGLHHAPGLALTDALARFRSMAGHEGGDGARASPRTAWSCHGLAVEVAVEQQLGIAGRAGWETYGAERFAGRCREFASRHVAAFAAFAERLGCGSWAEGLPATMDTEQVEAAWASLKAAFEQGLLVRRTTVRPYCPRCETILSRSELTGAGSSRETEDQLVIVRFRLTRLPPGASVAGCDLGQPGRELPATDLLVAVDEPWTLPGNTALAVDPAASYVIARRSGFDDRVVVADGQFARVLGEGWYVTGRISGAELVGAGYRPPFQPADSAGDRQVISAAFVNAASGTGVMHLAAAFGEAGLAAAEALRLPVANPILADGRFGDQLPLVSGAFFRDAGPALIGDLANRGLLFSARARRRQSAHCAHCGSPLLRSAHPAWFLLAAAADGQVTGPEGGPADWALSRTRFWGTPLPVWECERGHLTCAGSRAELSELAGADLSAMDPHRPWADAVVISCPQCGSPGHRVPEVVDARYDAAVAAARAARPGGPGVLITSGQDPDWPEALALAQRAAGAKVRMDLIRTGPVHDDRDRVVGAGAGNAIAAGPLLRAHGADAVRWYCLAAGGQGADGRPPAAMLAEVTERVLVRYWQAAARLTRCAGAAGVPAAPGPAADFLPLPPEARPPLDRWLISELHETIAEVTAAMRAGNPAVGLQRIERLIAGLSGWYLRRSRQRLRTAPGSPADAAALATLQEVLEALTRLMAPFAPFVTSRVWRAIRPAGTPDRVHLCSWPVADPAVIDEELAVQMGLARRIARLGRIARTTAGLSAGQEVDRAWVSADGFAALPPALKAEILDELKVADLRAARRPDVAESQPGLAVGRNGEAAWFDPGLTAAMRLAGLTGQETGG